MEYYAINNRELWEDTTIGEVQLAPTCKTSVDQFLSASLQVSNPVPEVGGFLLGNYSSIDDDTYQVHIAHFLKDDKAVTTPTQIQFDHSTLLQLDELNQDNDWSTIGWLHTHPSYTPFLSAQDFTIHEGFFRKKFQVAIVIDPLTEHWQSSIFSRRQNGTMNNNDPHKNQYHCFEWKKLTLSTSNEPIL